MMSLSDLFSCCRVSHGHAVMSVICMQSCQHVACVLKSVTKMVTVQEGHDLYDLSSTIIWLILFGSKFM
jgi:hypothetical protein